MRNTILNGVWGNHVKEIKKRIAGIKKIDTNQINVKHFDFELLSEENRPTLPDEYFKHLKHKK